MGNQLFEYAAARRLAYKLGVELKLKPWFDKRFKDRPQYELENFNISGELATPEDIENVNKINAERETPLGVETKYPNGLFRFIPEILDYPDNVNLSGCWQSEKYFADIEDVLRRELTFKFDDTGGGENPRNGLQKFARRIAPFRFMSATATTSPTTCECCRAAHCRSITTQSASKY